MAARVEHRVRVIYGDTDAAGIAYYANFLRWFEAARGAFLRERASSYADIQRRGISFPVVEVRCRYLRPARYDDDLLVEAEVADVRAASFRFEYRVTRDGSLLAEGHTLHACAGGDGRPTRLPDDLRALLSGPSAG